MEGVDCTSRVKILLSGVRKHCLRLIYRFKSGKALSVFSPYKVEKKITLVIWFGLVGGIFIFDL